MLFVFFFFFSSRRRHTRWNCDWSSDVCSSDLREALNAWNYLDSISKHLELLSRQKVLEKDYTTQLNILKEKRDQDTPAQRLDYIQGWGIPSLLEKTNNEDEARLYLSKLLEFVSNLDLALASGKNRFVVAKEGMEWLYDKQKRVIY